MRSKAKGPNHLTLEGKAIKCQKFMNLLQKKRIEMATEGKGVSKMDKLKENC